MRDGLAWPPVVLFLVVFFWAPPHFWALAMRYREDYAAATGRLYPSIALGLGALLVREALLLLRRSRDCDQLAVPRPLSAP